jgi:hypothetical protein
LTSALTSVFTVPEFRMVTVTLAVDESCPPRFDTVRVK